MSRDDFSTRNNRERRDEWDESQEEQPRQHPRPRPPQRDPRARPGQTGQPPRLSQRDPGGVVPRRASRANLPPGTYRDETGQIRRQPPIQGRPSPPRNPGTQGPNPPRRPIQRQTRDFREEEQYAYDEYDERVPTYRETDFVDDDYDEYDAPYGSTGYPTSRRPRSGTPRRQKRRGAWSTLLVGCIGGIITVVVIVAVLVLVLYHSLPSILPGLGIGTTTYTDKQQSVPLAITASITRLEVQNPVGDVTISVDSSATTSTLTYTKKTQASSSSSAATEFGRINVTAGPGGTSATCPVSSCLAVTASLPATGSDSVEMAIVLSSLNPSLPSTISEKTQKGNISVQGFQGLLALTDDTGNISVTGGLLEAGSCLQSRIGNVSFSGTLEIANPPTINPCAGNPINPNAGSANNQPWYSVKTGTGNIDVTFLVPPGAAQQPSFMLDVTIANKGAIKGDYNLQVTQNPDGSSNYFGPLLPNTQPKAFLTLTVDVAGTITLHKAAS